MDETQFAQQLAAVDQRARSNTHQIEDLKRRQDDLDKLVTAMATMEQKQTDMESDLKEIKTDVKQLTDKPGKRWEQLVTTIIATLAGAVLGVVLARLGVS